jgi:hypothetical protein
VVPGFVLSRESPQPQQQGTRQAVSHRQGNRLRVWLARPFHGSGYPEEIAVVLPEKNAPVPPALEKLVTLWGADPASRPPSVRPLDLDFPLAHPTPPQPYPLQGVSGRMRIAPHPVAYDAASDRYYCDIVVSGLEGVYMPFLRLAVATFQRAASPECALSHIVVAGTVQLLPDRIASLEVAADHSLDIAVRGQTSVRDNNLDIAERDVSDEQLRAGLEFLGGKNQGIVRDQQFPHKEEVFRNPGVDGWVPDVRRGVANLVTVRVESRPAGSTQDWDWTPNASRQRSLVVRESYTDPRDPPDLPLRSLTLQEWRGIISRDQGATGDHAWRLAVREYEFSSEGTTDGGQGPVATRLVFAEHFDVPEWAAPAPPPLPGGLRGAVIWPNNNKLYLFKGARYYSYTIDGEEGVDPGYPQLIESKPGGWPGLAEAFPEGIDTGVVWPNLKAYFFKGSRYLRYTIGQRVDDGYPKPIKGSWPRLADVFPEGVDAVFVNKEKAYFFKGSQYVQYNIGFLPGSGPEGVDPGYPKAIAEDWPRLAEHFPNGVDAAARWPNGKIYFFKGDQYVRYSMDQDPKGVDPGYPMQIGAKII